MSHIFISYSRKDLAFAQKIVDSLAANNLDTWIDWKSIPKGEDWEQEIYRGIEEADAFLFLISPDSVASAMCNKEIDHAVKNGKRILPIVIRDTDPKIIHPEISKRNWIFCHEGQYDFSKSIDETRKTIHADYEWLKYHTELQVKALRWEQKKDNSRLLRGKELQEAEEQLAGAGNLKEPQPTELQRNYVLESNKERLSRLSRNFLITMGVFAAIAAIIFAWGQSNKQTALALANQVATVQAANTQIAQQRDNARVSELSALALYSTGRDTDLALLLSAAAYDKNPRNLTTMQSLFGTLASVAGDYKRIEIQPDYKAIGISTGSLAGKILAIAGENRISLWNISDNQDPIEIGEILMNGLNHFVLSPDGKLLVASITAGTGETLEVWDINKPGAASNTYTSERLDASVVDLSFSPDGSMLATVHDDSVKLWDFSKHLPTQFGTLNIQALVVAFSPDGKLLAASGWDQIISLWNISDPRTPVLIRSISGHSDRISSLAFSPNGKLLASGSWDKSIILWEISDSLVVTQQRVLYGHEAAVESLTFSLDGRQIISGGDDQNVMLWDVSSTSSDPKTILRGHSAGIFKALFVLGDELLVSASNDQVFLWYPSTPIPALQISRLDGQTGYLESIAFSPDGNLLASGSLDKTIYLWSVQNPSSPLRLGVLQGHSDGINTLTFDPSGRLLASGGRDGKVILWDVSDLTNPHKLAVLDYGSQNVQRVLFSPTAATLVVGIEDRLAGDTGPADFGGNIFLWDVTKPSAPRRIEVFSGYPELGYAVLDADAQLESLSFGPNGLLLAAGNRVGRVVLWNLSDLSSAMRNISSDKITGYFGPILDLSFHPNGNILAAATADREIILWDVSDLHNEQQLSTPSSHSQRVLSVAFSPDGHMLASGGEDNAVALWEVSNYRQPFQIGILGRHLSNVTDVVFSPNGKILASASHDKSVILWNMDFQSLVNAACDIAGRNFTQAEWQQYFPGEEYRLTCPQWPAGE